MEKPYSNVYRGTTMNYTQMVQLKIRPCAAVFRSSRVLSDFIPPPRSTATSPLPSQTMTTEATCLDLAMALDSSVLEYDIQLPGGGKEKKEKKAKKEKEANGDGGDEVRQARDTLRGVFTPARAFLTGVSDGVVLRNRRPRRRRRRPRRRSARPRRRRRRRRGRRSRPRRRRRRRPRRRWGQRHFTANRCHVANQRHSPGRGSQLGGEEEASAAATWCPLLTEWQPSG